MDRSYSTALATFVITLMFVPGCKEESSSTAIIPGPTASFTYSGTPVTPATISFQNTSQNSNIFRWEFGDGTVSQVVSPIKIYPIRGVYTVRLVAMNTNYFTYAKSDTAIQQIIITPGKLFVDTVIVSQVPFVDPTGVPWDSDSLIDLEFLLTGYEGGRTSYLWGPPVRDVSPASLPVIWHFDSSARLDAWNRAYRIGLWDRVPYYPIYIGETNMFMISDSIAASGYPTVVRLQDHRGTISVRIILQWQ
jgi:hypothetical protein